VFRRRGLLLVVGGVVATEHLFATSILQNYGVVFLVAPLLLRLPTRPLLAIAAASAALGPVMAQTSWPSLELPDDVLLLRWIEVGLVEPVNAGYYPLTVWVCFFVVGILLGRLDLTDRLVARRLTLAAAAGLAAWVPIHEAVDRARASASGPSPALADGFDAWQLTESYAHADTPAWMVEHLLLALLVLGGCLRLSQPRRWCGPVVALGAISLTAYVLQDEVVGVVGERWFPDQLLGTWHRTVALFLALEIALVSLAAFVRPRFRRGPLEWLVRRLSRPRPAPGEAPVRTA
jgi:uncharacterized membrane protein YeiB